MKDIIRIFEKLIIMTLVGITMVVVFLSLIEVCVVLWQQLSKPPFMLLDLSKMMEVFGFILMVIIGLELLDTIKAYLNKQAVHVEIVMVVAIVAVARKVIIMDYKEITPQMVLAIAVLVLALSIGFFAVRRALDAPWENRSKKIDD